jgi:UDP-N-acetylglucosamine 2-epimerase (non-hydrolysing)
VAEILPLHLRTHAQYALLTLQRPSNVDVPEVLSGILDALAEIQSRLPIIFPAHPHTVKRIAEFGFDDRLALWNTSHSNSDSTEEAYSTGLASLPALRITEPLGYLDFLNLMANAKIVLTDSGGIQEETTILGVPLRQRTSGSRSGQACLTLRENTERPVTVTQGTNRIVGNDPECIVKEAVAALDGAGRAGRTPELWDGRSAERGL